MVLATPDRVRAQRRLFHGAMGTRSSLEKFTNVQEVEVQRFLLRVLEKPEGLLEHVST